MNISKSDFLKYRECSSYFWMHIHSPEKIEQQPLTAFDQQLMQQGREVEEWARKLFPHGNLISSTGNNALIDTQVALGDASAVLFQPSFTTEGLHARLDMLESTPNGFNIYEVKGTTAKNKKKVEHLYDMAFQREVLRKAGYQVGRLYLVEVNREFVKKGPIDPHQLLTVTDVTEQVIEIEVDFLMQLEHAQRILEGECPKSCACMSKPRKDHCPTFHHFHPKVPAYAIHDIARIGSSIKRLRNLVNDGYFGIDEIPLDYDLTRIQLNQVSVNNLNQPIIKPQAIADSLAEVQYPIYFLDYETYPAAVPAFDGCYPFQQVPFQYSLHVLSEPGDQLIHKEFLHTESSNPMQPLAHALRKDMGDVGSVVVWNQRFEGKCNQDLAIANPDLADFLLGINARFYDLMKIFSKQWFVHKGFRGKTSLKKVLPVLCPHLSYADLEIQDGGAACSEWRRMIDWEACEIERAQIAENLLRYCELDTLAMVEIMKALEMHCPNVYRYHKHSGNNDILQSMLEASLATINT